MKSNTSLTEISGIFFFSVPFLLVSLSWHFRQLERIACSISSLKITLCPKCTCRKLLVDFCLFLIIWVQMLVFAKIKTFFCFPFCFIFIFLTKAKECSWRGELRYCSSLGKERQFYCELHFFFAEVRAICPNMEDLYQIPSFISEYLNPSSP